MKQRHFKAYLLPTKELQKEQSFFNPTFPDNLYKSKLTTNILADTLGLQTTFIKCLLVFVVEWVKLLQVGSRTVSVHGFWLKISGMDEFADSACKDLEVCFEVKRKSPLGDVILHTILRKSIHWPLFSGLIHYFFKKVD